MTTKERCWDVIQDMIKKAFKIKMHYDYSKDSYRTEILPPRKFPVLLWMKRRRCLINLHQVGEGTTTGRRSTLWELKKVKEPYGA